MKLKKLTFIGLAGLSLAACQTANSATEESTASNASQSEDFIADRELTGLIFMSDGDVYADIPAEIQEKIKAETGITLKLQGAGAADSQEALAAGLASGDLPDFIMFNLNNSGRPEMQLVLNAANQGMFHDIAPLLEESEVYGKYFEEGFLPVDTKENIMFREEWDGASYLVHRSINRNVGEIDETFVGGLWLKADIAEGLGIDPLSITTSEQLHELAKAIQDGDYTDANGNPVTPIGPTQWGGTDRRYLYEDISWTGDSYEKFFPDAEGKVLHESQTDYMMKRIAFVHQLFEEKPLHPEYFTMDEPRAQEGIINGSFAIVSDMNNNFTKVEDGTYVKLGPIERVDGTDHPIVQYKAGYGGWAVPQTTENPEDIVEFADWLASDEGKLLWNYGIEGRDYELDENGFPLIKEEVFAELETDPEQAKERGFGGVGGYWGEYLGDTDTAPMEDFNEPFWGYNEIAKNSPGTKIAEEYWSDERVASKEVIDGMTPKAFLFEFEGSDGNLTTALNRYEEDLVRAYYADSLEEAEDIMKESKASLEANGLIEYQELINQKIADGVEIIY